MKNYKFRFISLLLITLPISAWGWGDYGHKVIGEIAIMNLAEADRKELARLTRLYRTPDNKKFNSYASALTLPDLARSKTRSRQQEIVQKWRHFFKFSRWHFFNVPRNTHQIESADCADNCVLSAIDWHLKKVQETTLNEQQRAQALFFLGHWIGDIHQPLHISFADDLGGNTIKPIYGDYYNSYNLHAVWDSGILKKAMDGEAIFTYAKKLNNAITDAERADWTSNEPLSWAQESYDIATSANADYCEWQAGQKNNFCVKQSASITLTSSYQKNFQPLVEQRLQQAGIRLAEYIRRGLHPDQ